MHVKNLVKFMKKDEGSGLILALMTLMVLSVLGASLGTITIGSYKLADVNRENTSAYYIAEAGANMAYEEMKSVVLTAYQKDSVNNQTLFFDSLDGKNGGEDTLEDQVTDKINNGNMYNFAEQFGDTPKVTINIDLEPDSNPRIYVIESTGEIAGKSRTVNKTVEVTWAKETEVDLVPETPERAAVISKGKIFFASNGCVADNIVSYSNEISWNGNGKVNSNNKCNKHFGGELPPIQSWDVYENLAGSFPTVLPEKFGEKLNNHNINLTDSDNLFFYTKILNLGDLNINGDGIVNIFVEEELNFTGDSFNSDKDFKNNFKNDYRNVRIFYAGKNKLEIKKNYVFNASLFVKEAPINIEKQVSFRGVLLYGGTEEIELDVKDTFMESYLIAPRAKVSLSNHVKFSGSIIAKSVVIDNQVTVIYDEIGSLPFSFKGTGIGGDVSSNEIITSEPGIEN